MTHLFYPRHSLHMVIFVGNALKEILTRPPTRMLQSPSQNMLASAEEQHARSHSQNQQIGKDSRIRSAI